eukprot:Awhi_evm1s4444
MDNFQNNFQESNRPTYDKQEQSSDSEKLTNIIIRGKTKESSNIGMKVESTSIVSSEEIPLCELDKHKVENLVKEVTENVEFKLETIDANNDSRKEEEKNIGNNIEKKAKLKRRYTLSCRSELEGRSKQYEEFSFDQVQIGVLKDNYYNKGLHPNAEARPRNSSFSAYESTNKVSSPPLLPRLSSDLLKKKKRPSSMSASPTRPSFQRFDLNSCHLGGKRCAGIVCKDNYPTDWNSEPILCADSNNRREDHGFIVRTSENDYIAGMTKTLYHDQYQSIKHKIFAGYHQQDPYIVMCRKLSSLEYEVLVWTKLGTVVFPVSKACISRRGNFRRSRFLRFVGLKLNITTEDFGVNFVRYKNTDHISRLVEIEKLHFDNYNVKKRKVGLLYISGKEITEESLFCPLHREISEEYKIFLNNIGGCITLKDWPFFAAGLDTKNNKMGTHSIHSMTADDGEIMYHVPHLIRQPYETKLKELQSLNTENLSHAFSQTLRLPRKESSRETSTSSTSTHSLLSAPPSEREFDKKEQEDLKQKLMVAIKRHIGNDACVIIFKDTNSTEPFSPSMIRTKFTQVFIVIQAVKLEDTISYCVHTCTKSHIPYFPPNMDSPSVFDSADPNFYSFLEEKIRFASIYSKYAPQMHQSMSLYRSELLTNFINENAPNIRVQLKRSLSTRSSFSSFSQTSSPSRSFFRFGKKTD